MMRLPQQWSTYELVVLSDDPQCDAYWFHALVCSRNWVQRIAHGNFASTGEQSPR